MKFHATNKLISTDLPPLFLVFILGIQLAAKTHDQVYKGNEFMANFFIFHYSSFTCNCI